MAISKADGVIVKALGAAVVAADGTSLTEAGKVAAVENAWSLFPEILKYCGDDGLADATVAAVAERMPPRDLNLLASEAIEAGHGYSEEFGGGDGYDDDDDDGFGGGAGEFDDGGGGEGGRKGFAPAQ